MAKQIQLRRGTTTENNAFKGALGELTYDTQKKELRVHDGSTVGGKVVDDKDRDVTSQVSVATETTAGKAKIATTAIAQAGVNDTDFITAKKLEDVNKMLKGWFKTSGSVVSGFGGSGIVGVTRVSQGVYTINTSFNINENPLFLGLVKAPDLPGWAGAIQLHPTILPTVNSITIITKFSGSPSFGDFPYLCFGVF